jgi:cytoskeletal protein CcmA (bactofilin family)
MSFFYGDVKSDEIKTANGLEFQGGTNNAYSLTIDIDSTIAANYNINLPASIGTTDQYLKITDVTDSTATLGFATIAGSGTVALNDITEGDSTSNLTTSAGDITIYSQIGNIDLNAVNHITILPTTQSTTSTTGALVVDGGVGIAKDVNINGNLSVSSTATMDFDLNVTGTTNLNDSTQSTSDSTGSLIVAGGVGIAKDVNITGNINIATDADITGTLTVSDDLTASSNVDITGNINIATDADITGTLTVSDDLTASSNVDITGNINVTKDLFLGANNDLEVSETTGNITIKNTQTDKDIIFNVNDNSVDTEIFRLDGSNSSVLVNSTNRIEFNDSTTYINSGSTANLNLNSTTITLTSDTTRISGDLIVDGTTTTINSNVTTIDDPVIELGTADVSETTFDRGIRYHYYNGSAKNGFFGLDRSEGLFTFYPDATFSTANVVSGGSVGDAKFNNLILLSSANIGANGNEFQISESGGDITLTNTQSDKDIIFNLNDGGTTKNLLQLDGSDNTVIATNMNTSNTFSLSQGSLSVSTTSTEVLDFSDRSDFIITLSGSSTLTLASTNVNRVGQQGTIIITQSSGTNSLTWQTSNGWYFPSATAPTLSAGSGIYDTFSYMVVEAGGSKKILVMDATNFQAY